MLAQAQLMRAEQRCGREHGTRAHQCLQARNGHGFVSDHHHIVLMDHYYAVDVYKRIQTTIHANGQDYDNPSCTLFNVLSTNMFYLV